jgi:hypothetical protein
MFKRKKNVDRHGPRLCLNDCHLVEPPLLPLYTTLCSAQIVQIFFINPRPAYHETEKGGEGERDTGTTSGKGVTRHIAQGYLRTYSLDRWRGAGKSYPTPPPPHIPLPLLDSLRLQRQISRIASNLKVVSMIADIGQQRRLHLRDSTHQRGGERAHQRDQGEVSSGRFS